MKKLCAITLLSLLSVTSFATDMVLPIKRVVDGDTISTTLNLPCPLCNVSIRILGIDTPESTYLAKCPAEKEKGLAAKSFLTKFAQGQTTMRVNNISWDKYGGRIDGIVVINGINVGDEMIKQGYAKPYTGSGPKPDWCV